MGRKRKGLKTKRAWSMGIKPGDCFRRKAQEKREKESNPKTNTEDIG